MGVATNVCRTLLMVYDRVVSLLWDGSESGQHILVGVLLPIDLEGAQEVDTVVGKVAEREWEDAEGGDFHDLGVGGDESVDSGDDVWRDCSTDSSHPVTVSRWNPKGRRNSLLDDIVADVDQPAEPVS